MYKFMSIAVFGTTILTEPPMVLNSPSSAPSNSQFVYNNEMQDWNWEESKRAGVEVKPTQPQHASHDGVWQPVAGAWFRFLVFSAYVESRTVAAVRVVAATKTRGADPVFCRLWLPDNRTITLKARVQTIREHHNLKYSAAYVLCLLRDSGVKPQETVGAAVAVMASAAPTRPPTNLLTVIDTEPKIGIEDTVHICVKPFHSSFDRYEWMIEWFELQRLMGVSHFYMYNSSLGNATSCLLHHYIRLGLVTLLPWKLPFASEMEIRTEGLFAAFNDCLYRSMRTAGWLLVVDVDEVVLPRLPARTLPEMLTALTADYKLHFTKPPSSLIFRNAFFYTLWEDDPEAPAPLMTARKTVRLEVVQPYLQRSKFVVRPRDAVELGNHFVWESAPGARPFLGVKPNGALLHHYRIKCENYFVDARTEGCLSLQTTIDRTAHMWSMELMQRFSVKKKLLAQACRA